MTMIINETIDIVIQENMETTLLIPWNKPYEDNGNTQISILKIGFFIDDPDFTIKEDLCPGVIESNGDDWVTRFETDDVPKSGITANNYVITIVGRKSQVGCYSLFVCVKYRIDGLQQVYNYLYQVMLRVTNEHILSLQSTSQEVSQDDEIEFERKLNPEEAEKKFQAKKKRLQNAVGFMKIPDSLYNNGKGRIVNWKAMSDLNPYNYCLKMAVLLYYEERQMEYDIRKFDMKNVSFKVASRLLHFRLEVPGLFEKRPSVLRGDKIGVKLSAHPSSQEIEGDVKRVLRSTIIVRFPDEMEKIYKSKFDVRFKLNRHPIRCMQRTLETIDEGLVIGRSFWNKLIFPKPQHLSSKPFASKESNLKYFNPMIEENEEQQEAVRQIVKGGVPGVPYIIFGPPGTGKTMTMVETILQIWKSQRESGCRILAAASSNSAADLLALRLLEVVPGYDIFRYYASSLERKKVPEKLVRHSNVFKKGINADGLKNYKIIVSTFVTCGRLSTFKFPQGHFTHVFMDEAGYSLEPEILTVVAGTIDAKGGQVVLAGDPKQLGAIIHSPLAAREGLQFSFLERLMDLEIYKPDPCTNKYNTNLITKLVRNFRSHESILRIPSKLFYNNELQTCASPEKTNLYLNWSELPRKGFPIIFNGIVGVETKEANNPSFYNPEEAYVVLKYLEKIALDHCEGQIEVDPDEVAIISPYRGQIHKINELIQAKYKTSLPVTIGSTEELQGQERSVIIISTVRSQVELLSEDFKFNMGFLRNPKRFNVALTRARALLIVVGNPFVLSIDPNWKTFLDYVIENGGYCGINEEEFRKSGIETTGTKLFNLEMALKEFAIGDENDVDDEPCRISQKELLEGPVWNYER